MFNFAGSNLRIGLSLIIFLSNVTFVLCFVVEPSFTSLTSLNKRYTHARSLQRIVGTHTETSKCVFLLAKEDGNQEEELEYRNLPTRILSNFMQKPPTNENDSDNTTESPVDKIDFQVPKLSRPLSMETLAAALNAELIATEWFVTGNVRPQYFADTFVFQDPDVRLEGIEAYARGVAQLFDPVTSRAEIVSTVPTAPNVITCTWRLSGKANIGPVGLNIKPYMVFTDFTVNEKGLIVFQQDRFDLPQWDILLSSLFPFLIGVVTAPPAPPVVARTVEMPKIPK